MSSRGTEGAFARTSGDVLPPREEVVVVRAGPWRLVVPMRHVERVLSAAMPAARPSSGPAAPVLGLGGDLVPVVFASALVGAGEVRLAASDQMIVLSDGERRAVLWVDAVEDVVAHAPVAAPAGAAPTDLVLGWSGAERPLPVLDVRRVLALST